MAKIVLFEDHRKRMDDGNYRFPAAGISYPVGHGARAGALDGYDVLIVRLYLHALAGTDDLLSVLMPRQSAAELEQQHGDSRLVDRIRVFQKWVNGLTETRVATDGRVSVPRSNVYGWTRGMGGQHGRPTPWTIEVMVREWRRSALDAGLRPLLSAHRDCPKILRAWLRKHGL